MCGGTVGGYAHGCSRKALSFDGFLVQSVYVHVY